MVIRGELRACGPAGGGRVEAILSPSITRPGQIRKGKLWDSEGAVRAQSFSSLRLTHEVGNRNFPAASASRGCVPRPSLKGFDPDLGRQGPESQA